jgi:hypothetical protein
MPEPMSAQDFAGPHPTCRELVGRLAAWGFTKRRDENVHTLYRGPHGGTLRVLRSELGRADPAVAEKAARLTGVTTAQFWAGPAAALATARVHEDPASPVRRDPATRDTVISIVLSVHAAADRPLGFDQVVELSGGRVTRAQASAASAALCRDGQLDRIRSGVYQWSAGQRAAARQVPAPRQDDDAQLSSPGPGQGTSASGVFGQLFPSGVRMTADLLADVEQWARLTGRLTSHADAAGKLPRQAWPRDKRDGRAACPKRVPRGLSVPIQTNIVTETARDSSKKPPHRQRADRHAQRRGGRAPPQVKETSLRKRRGEGMRAGGVAEENLEVPECVIQDGLAGDHVERV